MGKFTYSEISDLVRTKPYSVIHIDADWDGYRHRVQKQILSIVKEIKSDVAFGYVDCDEEHEYASDIHLMNTPSVAYYRQRSLIAVVIGVGQNIAQNIRIIMRGYTRYIKCS